VDAKITQRASHSEPGKLRNATQMGGVTFFLYFRFVDVAAF
jgi:hypothetical protein